MQNRYVRPTPPCAQGVHAQKRAIRRQRYGTPRFSPQGSVPCGSASSRSVFQSRPANDSSSFDLSTQTIFAFTPEAIISRLSCSVGIPHTGKSGSRLLCSSCFSRYARMSFRNRSPNAMASKCSSRARASTAPSRDSYSWFVQGQGNSTVQSGSPTASACSCTNALRTPCMATRSAAELKVVNRAAT